MLGSNERVCQFPLLALCKQRKADAIGSREKAKNLIHFLENHWGPILHGKDVNRIKS